MDDYYTDPGRKNIFRHSGFRYGLTGGVIMVVFHIVLLAIFQGTNQGDIIAWFTAWFVYFMVGRMAAQAHYQSQQENLEPLSGVKSAGSGAGLVTGIIIWIFIILRGVFRDALGMFIFVEPISLFCVITIDVIIAMAIGGWAGGLVERKYKIE